MRDAEETRNTEETIARRGGFCVVDSSGLVHWRNLANLDETMIREVADHTWTYGRYWRTVCTTRGPGTRVTGETRTGAGREEVTCLACLAHLAEEST